MSAAPSPAQRSAASAASSSLIAARFYSVKLRKCLERASIMCDKDLITRACLPAGFGKIAAKGPSDLSTIKFPVGTTVDAMERELILQTLSATGNNKTRAAELLGISLKTLHNKLKEYGGDRAETE